jgi:hypothetical protein
MLETFLEIQSDIEQMHEVATAPSTPPKIRELLRPAISNARQTLANLQASYQLARYYDHLN